MTEECSSNHPALDTAKTKEMLLQIIDCCAKLWKIKECRLSLFYKINVYCYSCNLNGCTAMFIKEWLSVCVTTLLLQG